MYEKYLTSCYQEIVKLFFIYQIILYYYELLRRFSQEKAYSTDVTILQIWQKAQDIKTTSDIYLNELFWINVIYLYMIHKSVSRSIYNDDIGI